MKQIITLVFGVLFMFSGFAQTEKPHYPIQAVPFTDVKISDNFWAPRLETVRTVTLPYTFQQCEETGRVKNFDIAAGNATGSFCGVYAFDDSDVYKIIEGAAYSLQVHPDPKLEAYVDGLIAKIAQAQEPDGYLYTWRTINEREKAAGIAKKEISGDYYKGSDQRWINEEKHSHETYNLGHLYEAAVAHYLATGKRSLLDIAIKSADLVDKNFGWEKDKLQQATGHQEIELGLAKLYLVTGEKKYLDLAKFFLDVRGYGEEYMQNHKKVTEQKEIVGHAVRACYMYASMADVAALTGSQEYLPALNSLWEDVVGRKMYVTGGIGSSGSNEGFSKPYDLPNYSAYCETCSSIAFVLWNQRMFQLTGDSKYVDVLERTLYNALDAGLSMSGDRFFYPNPLESRKNVERSPWFQCACCPSNVARFFPSIPGYVFAKRGNEVFVNLYTTSETTVENINSKGQTVKVKIAQQTEYPFDGKINLSIEPEKPNTFSLKLRIPGWAQGDAVPFDLYSFANHDGSQVMVTLNGKKILGGIKDCYLTIERKWKAGDIVSLVLPMPVLQVRGNSKIEATTDRYALQRGPLVYCLEGKDQPDDRILSAYVPKEVEFSSQFEAGLLGGVQTITFPGSLVNKKTAPDKGELTPMKMKAIPYFAWANRRKDNMLVWLPNSFESVRPLAQPTLASKSKVTASEGMKGETSAITDQWKPKNSNDHENPFVHWWPHFGTTEWVQYDFENEEQVGEARIYWFDDEASEGGCRIPKSFVIKYLENGEWKKCYSHDGWKVVKDGWSEVSFEPVKTTSLRLEFECQEGVSTGVHEWEVR
jgi:uncharacterized protein